MTTFTFTDDLEIDARLPAGRLRLLTCAAGEARVELRADGPGGRELIEDARVELDDDRSRTARLIVHVPRSTGRPRLLGGLRDAGVDATIWCPAGSHLRANVASADVHAEVGLGSVAVDTASGQVVLSAVTGRLEVSTASGDIAVGEVDGDGSMRSASGDVRADVVGGGLDARTASGDIRVGAVAGDVDIRSVSGDVEVLHAAGRRMSINSTSGDVQLALAPGRGVHLDVATVSGSLSSDLDEDDGSGGVDVELRARTVSGDVHVRRSKPVDIPAG